MFAACLTDSQSYIPRSPRKNQYYQCVEDHFEELERCWDDRYKRSYGNWRPHVVDVIYEYLDCGDLHMGFARVKCNDCNHEYLLPFSCKKRYFCPSCHQRRVIEFGEMLNEEVLQQVPHRQWVFSLPKRLRPLFIYNRKLLGKLSRCSWEVLSRYLKHGVEANASLHSGSETTSFSAGAVMAVQTFGEQLNFNPHIHVIATDGCFDSNGNFIQSNFPQASDLEALFQLAVFRLLKKEGKINDAVIENMMSWQHSGFHVYCGDPMGKHDKEGLERLAQYVVRAPISQERMNYVSRSEATDHVAKVFYEGKTSHIREVFTGLDWLARLVTHIPNKGEQLVRYYGFYSNKSRGMRKKQEAESVKTEADIQTAEAGQVPVIIQMEVSKKRISKSWARLIQKIYNADPLLCPKCKGTMRIISFIEEASVIKEILVHLKLWMPDNHDPPIVEPDIGNTKICIEIGLSNSQEECISGMPTEYMQSVIDSYSHRFQKYEYVSQSPYEYNISQATIAYEDDYSQLNPDDDNT